MTIAGASPTAESAPIRRWRPRSTASGSTTSPSKRSAWTIGNSSPSIRSAAEEASVAKSEEKYEVTLSDAEWRQRLSQEAYGVLRKHGTERAGTSPLDKRYDPGTYVCAGCEQ